MRGQPARESLKVTIENFEGQTSEISQNEIWHRARECIDKFIVSVENYSTALEYNPSSTLPSPSRLFVGAVRIPSSSLASISRPSVGVVQVLDVRGVLFVVLNFRSALGTQNQANTPMTTKTEAPIKIMVLGKAFSSDAFSFLLSFAFASTGKLSRLSPFDFSCFSAVSI